MAEHSTKSAALRTYGRRVAAALALTAVAVAVGVQAPQRAAGVAPADCQSDPSAAIAALAPGDTFYGSGCYLVPNGITLTQPVTLVGGTYVDPSTTKSPSGRVQPVIWVSHTTDVTLQGLTIIGGNPTGAFVKKLVGQAGIELMNTARVTIEDVSVSGTFGDGLELWANAPNELTPNTDVSVDGLAITKAGRNGISLSDVYGATFTNVSIDSWGLTSVDFESDIAGIGAGNVTFADSTWGGTIFTEAVTGPLSFERCTNSNTIRLTARAATTFPITFSDGSLAIGSKATNIGVYAHGPTDVTFNNETFTRLPRPNGKPQKTPMWNASAGAKLTFNNSTLSMPLGINDATSVVTINP